MNQRLIAVRPTIGPNVGRLWFFGKGLRKKELHGRVSVHTPGLLIEISSRKNILGPNSAKNSFGI